MVDIQKKLKAQSNKSGGFWSVVQSTLSGLFGIQSSAKREQDFQNTDPLNFIIAGSIGLILLLLAMGLVVRYVLA